MRDVMFHAHIMRHENSMHSVSKMGKIINLLRNVENIVSYIHIFKPVLFQEIYCGPEMKTLGLLRLFDKSQKVGPPKSVVDIICKRCDLVHNGVTKFTHIFQ